MTQTTVGTGKSLETVLVELPNCGYGEDVRDIESIHKRTEDKLIEVKRLLHTGRITGYKIESGIIITYRSPYLRAKLLAQSHIRMIMACSRLPRTGQAS